MPIIRSDAGIVTQINVFTVPAGGQQALIDLLIESALFARNTPGLDLGQLAQERRRHPGWSTMRKASVSRQHRR
jgi:hypothetical protein